MKRKAKHSSMDESGRMKLESSRGCPSFSQSEKEKPQQLATKNKGNEMEISGSEKQMFGVRGKKRRRLRGFRTCAVVSLLRAFNLNLNVPVSCPMHASSLTNLFEQNSNVKTSLLALRSFLLQAFHPFFLPALCSLTPYADLTISPSAAIPCEWKGV
mmetsp:Transcript_23034/g.45336  ORF Transcript_23034/g.45336 Transcript_23034/m.45336 type:complete len:157 (+) Transcript_23034:661-1131(+)